MRKINKIKLFNKNTVEAWSLGRTRKWLARIKNHYDGLKEIKNDSYWIKNDMNDFEEYIEMLSNQIIKKEKGETKIIVHIENDELSG